MSLIAGRCDLYVQANTTWRERWIYRDKATGLPIPLTGYQARMQIRDRVTGASITLAPSTANGMLIINGAQGSVDLIVQTPDTKPLTPDGATTQYDYGIELFDATAPFPNVLGFLQGVVTVAPRLINA